MNMLPIHRPHFAGIVPAVFLMTALAFSAVLVAPALGAVLLTIPERVEIENPEVVLGDLADISGADAALAQQMRIIPVGRAPLAGHSRTISRDYLLLRLRQSGIDPASIILASPDKVTLVRRAVTISAADLEMLVREYLVQNPPYNGVDLSITGVRIPGDVMLPMGDIQHEIQFLPQSKPSGSLPVNIFFSVDGAAVKRVMATVQVVLMKDVPVTRHPIARYQFIQPEDLMLQTMDVADLPANTVLAFEEIEGQRARRNIGPQTVLRTDQFEMPPAVNRGDRVLILAESSGLRITTVGEIQNPAKVGDRVRVVNLDSNKTLWARVVDARTVQVEF